MMAFGSLAVVSRSDGSMPEAERHVRCANLEQGEPRRSIMSHRNQDTSVRSRNVLCAALLVGLSLFPTSATRAEDAFRKACKVGTSVSILETDGNANSCRALAIQANVQNYQIGCQGAEHKDAIMLTTPISINDKSARLTSASLMANTENTKHAPEEVTACAKFWGSR
jgi:hypothetical protein